MNDLLDPAALEDLYRRDPDPWRFGTRPYEVQRHRATVAAVLAEGGPCASVLELGAATGELSLLLAARCERLTTIECAPTAVAIARRRLRAVVGGCAVEVLRGVVPRELPHGRFHRIVAAEVLYYLDDTDLAATIERLAEALEPGGRLVAVHWTGRSERHRRSGADVHRALDAHPALRRTRRGGGGRDGHRYLLDVHARA